MKKSALILPIFFTLCQVSAQEIPTLTMDAYKRIDKPARNEVSGIVKSRFYENTFWVHGDSGTPNRIYAINEKGEIIKKAEDARISLHPRLRGSKLQDWIDDWIKKNLSVK